MLLFTACSDINPTAKTELEKEEQRIADYHNKLLNFAIKNNISDYVLSDDEKLIGFSIDKQNAIQGKTYIFDSYLSDIFIKNDKTYVLFEDFSDSSFVFECSTELADKIKKDNGVYDEYYNSYFTVAASIKSIDKLNYSVDASGNSEDGYDITLGNPNITIYTGTCIYIEVNNE